MTLSITDTVFITLSVCVIALICIGILWVINRVRLYFSECYTARIGDHIASFGVCKGMMERECMCQICPHYYKNLREE